MAGLVELTDIERMQLDRLLALAGVPESMKNILELFFEAGYSAGKLKAMSIALGTYKSHYEQLPTDERDEERSAGPVPGDMECGRPPGCSGAGDGDRQD